MRFLDRLKDRHWNTKAKYVLLFNDILHSEEEEFHLTGSEYTPEEAKQILKDTKILIEHCARKTTRYYEINIGICCLMIILPLLIKFNFVYWGTWFVNSDENTKGALIAFYVAFCIIVQIIFIIWPFYLSWLPNKLVEKNKKELERLINIKSEILRHYNV